MMRLQRLSSLFVVASGLVLVACGQGPDNNSASGAGGQGTGGAGGTTTGSAASGSGGSNSNAPHGMGMCGGGFGDPSDLAHVPLCPSTPTDFHTRFAASRANYYHDGTHVFEPQFVNEDPALAMVAQDYASKYAAGQVSPNGMIYDNGFQGYDVYWDGTYQGYRAVAGMETPTSCNCPPPDPSNPFIPQKPAPVFYNLGNAYFRANIIRIDGMSRMGIGHIGKPDGSHYWAFVFAP
jgi:hypothetical protein